MKTGVEFIAEKRMKHFVKGFSKNHDASHKHGELAMCASALAAHGTDMSTQSPYEEFGTGKANWGLLNNDEIDRLAIAGSLIAAEIDRLIAIGTHINGVRLSELRPGDEFQYQGAEDWHVVTRIDDEKLYYPGGINEQINWRVDDVYVTVRMREEAQHES